MNPFLHLPPAFLKLAAVSAGAAVLAGSMTGCGKAQARKSEPPAPPGPTVTQNRIDFPADARELKALAVAGVEKCQHAVLRLHGRLTWDENATVRVFSPFAGRVTRVAGELGAVLDKDAPLAIIASPDFGQAQADARKADSDLAQADRNLARLRELFDHGAAAAKDVAAAESDRARAHTESMRARGRLALYGGAGEAIDNNYELKCPITGTVVERNVSVGQEVRPDQMLAGLDRIAAPLFVLTDPSRLWAQLDVPDAELPRLHRGQAVEIRSSTLAQRSFPGVVEVIGDSLDPLARTARVRVSVQNPEHALKNEMLITAELKTDEPQSVQVPAKAVFHLGEHAYVFARITAQAFERRPVRIGACQDEAVQILEGLQVGESVVADGALLLQQLLEHQTPAAASPTGGGPVDRANPVSPNTRTEDTAEAPQREVAAHSPPTRSPGHR